MMVSRGKGDQAMMDLDLDLDHGKLDVHADPESRYYGRLLSWFGSPGLAWHFGIGLSDSHFFNTGPQDWRILEMSAQQPTLVKGIPVVTPVVVISRLEYALHVFREWPYDLLRWNCEHLGRLVATGDPICYQVASAPLLSFWLQGGRHPTAKSRLESWLSLHASDLKL